jgi:hypothetical protein
MTFGHFKAMVEDKVANAIVATLNKLFIRAIAIRNEQKRVLMRRTSSDAHGQMLKTLHSYSRLRKFTAGKYCSTGNQSLESLLMIMLNSLHTFQWLILEKIVTANFIGFLY